MLKNLIKSESGATAIEYGLIAALVAVVIVGSMGTLGTEVYGIYDYIEESASAALSK